MDPDPHRWPIRVYYEDTDLGGIVYYANYLKYIERARTEWVRARGLDQTRLKERDGVVFVVRRVVADYIAPARFDDEVEVVTAILKRTPARIVLEQVVERAGAGLFRAEVTLAAIGPGGRPVRLPAELR